MIKQAIFSFNSEPDKYYILFMDADNFASTTSENYNAKIINERQITHFNKHDGFLTLSDCMNHIKRESIRYGDPVCSIAIFNDKPESQEQFKQALLH